MEQNYDFNSVGKKMPYTVPDGFFDQLEENVMKAWNVDHNKREEKSWSSERHCHKAMMLPPTTSPMWNWHSTTSARKTRTTCWRSIRKRKNSYMTTT